MMFSSGGGNPDIRCTIVRERRATVPIRGRGNADDITVQCCGINRRSLRTAQAILRISWQAVYYAAVQHHANVVNMSFDLTSSSPSLTQAVAYANKAGVVLVAAAGNENKSAPVYPAALNSYVVGIASTTNWDSRSSFSNYGATDVWIAAPGENIISTPSPAVTYGSASGTIVLVRRLSPAQCL